MGKQAIFTLTLGQELRDEFVAAAQASDQSPSDVLQDMMQDFIQQQKMAPDYLAFMQEKAAIARSELDAGEAIGGDEVEREFSALRAATTARMR
ncbi:antitoxin of toxin-antitoxin stability system [Neorhizobium sp. NCHU2750]|uniref:antitoxin of toxin-antitoxin stability system n=1 Tax=Neorhizobium sp. NCHU2750 TaxID=1825976 RepID=UPI000E731457|nr:antitoxin [Neorhizobium sp. NCHU2750]